MRQNSISTALTGWCNFKNLNLYSYAKQTLQKNYSYLSGSCNVICSSLRAAENRYRKGTG